MRARLRRWRAGFRAWWRGDWPDPEMVERAQRVRRDWGM